MSLAVIVPSRGRPQNIAALTQAWTDTGATADVIVGVDDDDPVRADYYDVCAAHPHFDLVVGPRLRMAGTLNHLATAYAADAYDHLAFLGDDHRPRTAGWDQLIGAELERLGTGIVYGNDLIQGENLPTAVFMTSNIVRTLGWMAPPGLTHLFLDDAWLTLGRALNAISYLPDVIIEHCHPVAGTAPSDAGYVECNAPAMWAHDQAVFEQWRTEHLAGDVERLQAARV